MGYFQLRQDQTIDGSLDEVWAFISNPHNLKTITPPYMGFDILTPDLPDKIYPGMIISYKVSPLLWVKMDWVSEITQAREGEFFVDEQRIGPYRMWHHQHWIRPCGKSVIMSDLVTYQPPLGAIGSLANYLVIRRKLEEIFIFRRQRLEKIFNNR